MISSLSASVNERPTTIGIDYYFDTEHEITKDTPRLVFETTIPNEKKNHKWYFPLFVNARTGMVQITIIGYTTSTGVIECLAHNISANTTFLPAIYLLHFD